MLNATEKDEREYLEQMKEKLVLATRRVDKNVRDLSEELRENKQYIYEHQHGLDEADMVAADQSLNRMASTGEGAVVRRNRLMKLMKSPYFGRIDFDSNQQLPVYIGIHTFFDEMERANLIYDWRAPISSMFYDFELGPAHYVTPSGKVEGEITLKRQYKIIDGAMEYMIENAVNIQDELLQRELSKSADDKMKNIVATIQRDQNAVIRNEESTVMIIQGVAGSGKTSIALHRIAFLLYRFRDTIRSKDVMILSPNKVFADYISNVLPELGEEQIPEMVMEELAAEVLENKFRFQTFFDQVAMLLERKHSTGFAERIQFKASFDFLKKLNQYMIHLENNFFVPVELRIGKVVVPSPFIHERFKKYHRLPLLKRIPEVVKDIYDYIRDNRPGKLQGYEKKIVWEAVPRMIRFTDFFSLYRNFYKWLKNEEMFVTDSNGLLEYADVFPLIYCKIRLEGAQTYDHVKHLLIDEMQDYTPVQYSVISRLFKCRKTILGDIGQRVNPYSASSAEAIHEIFPFGDTVKLLRSYRSTWEITMFAQKIIRNPEIIPMERHGEEPAVKGFENHRDEVHAIQTMIRQFHDSGLQSMGIICKTPAQAQHLFKELQREQFVNLLTTESTAFKHGAIITTAHLAKGLEFDEVIIPFASAENYASEIDRSVLYIACTRAMHKLTLTFVKEKSTFLI